MSRFYRSVLPAALLSSVLLAGSAFTGIAYAGEGHESNSIVLYFTRHAEKQTVVREVEENTGMYVDNCKDDRSRCEEELSPLGEERADLLAEWFERRGIAPDVTHVVSTDKQRTRQTVQPLADLIAQYDNEVALHDQDGVDDGVWQVPFAGDTGNEINGNSGSVIPTIEFIGDLNFGDVAVIAGHSGTLYKIFSGLGIDITDNDQFPKDAEEKVDGFGDVWKLVIRPDGFERKSVFKWRKRLDFERLTVVNH